MQINAIITILLSGFMTLAAVAGEWLETEWVEPKVEEGWSAPKEFKHKGDRYLAFHSNDDNKIELLVNYDEKGNIHFNNQGEYRLKFHVRDEPKNRWFEMNLGSQTSYTVQGGEAKVWYKRVA